MGGGVLYPLLTLGVVGITTLQGRGGVVSDHATDRSCCHVTSLWSRMYPEGEDFHYILHSPPFHLQHTPPIFRGTDSSSERRGGGYATLTPPFGVAGITTSLAQTLSLFSLSVVSLQYLLGGERCE